MLGVAVGVLTFALPGVTAVVLLYLIAFWAVFTGIAEIVAAFQLRRHIEGEWALVLGGVLSVLFGMFLFLAPAETRAAMPGRESARVASPASQSLPARVCTAAKATTISTTRPRPPLGP